MIARGKRLASRVALVNDHKNNSIGFMAIAGISLLLAPTAKATDNVLKSTKPISAYSKAGGDYLEIDEPLPNALETPSFSELIRAIRTEKNNEIKSKCLVLLIKKTKTATPPKEDWINLKTLLEGLLHEIDNVSVLANTLLLSQLVLPPEELLNEVNQLLEKISQTLSGGDLIQVNNAINLVLFEALVNSDSAAFNKAVAVTFTLINKNILTENLSVFISDFPEKKLKKDAKKVLHKTITQTKSRYFHTRNFFKNHYRVKTWSSALLKVKEDNIKAVDELYRRVETMNDSFVIALIVLANKDHITTVASKQHFLNLMKRQPFLKQGLITSLEKMTQAQAQVFLTSNQHQGDARP